VPVLAVERRIDVPAAGQQQPVESLDDRAGSADLEQPTRGLLDRRDVVVLLNG
jgi:hypothetical protein